MKLDWTIPESPGKPEEDQGMESVQGEHQNSSNQDGEASNPVEAPSPPSLTPYKWPSQLNREKPEVDDEAILGGHLDTLQRSRSILGRLNDRMEQRQTVDIA